MPCLTLPTKQHHNTNPVALLHQVNDLINQELGPLVEDRSQYARNREKYLAESSAPRERKKWPEEKIVIGLESLRNFNVRAKVVGPGVSGESKLLY